MQPAPEADSARVHGPCAAAGKWPPSVVSCADASVLLLAQKPTPNAFHGCEAQLIKGGGLGF